LIRGTHPPHRAWFPTLSLTAQVGTQGSSLADLLSWPTHVLALGLSAAETLLDFGARKATVARAQALYEAQVAGYLQTVLSAFKEVGGTRGSWRGQPSRPRRDSCPRRRQTVSPPRP